MMHKTYRFNLRLCNSASKLNGCLGRQKFLVTIAISTKGEIVQLNENLLMLTSHGILHYLCSSDLSKSFSQIMVSIFIISQ